MNDPIVEEVRRNREAHAATFNYDLDAIYQNLKEHERLSGRKFVTFSGVRASPFGDSGHDRGLPRAKSTRTVSEDIASPPTDPGVPR